MKNQIFKTILIIFAFVSFFNTAYATLNIDTTVDVPVSCSVTDTDGAVHNYPQADSYLAICALEKALEQNIVSAIDFVDFGFGLFINSVNNISQNNTYSFRPHNFCRNILGRSGNTSYKFVNRSATNKLGRRTAIC